jgi:cell division protein FtsL
MLRYCFLDALGHVVAEDDHADHEWARVPLCQEETEGGVNRVEYLRR